jgi:hypothetical protein
MKDALEDSNSNAASPSSELVSATALHSLVMENKCMHKTKLRQTSLRTVDVK